MSTRRSLPTWLIGAIIVLSACTPVSIPPPTATLEPAPTQTATLPPSPTATFTPVPTPTLTPIPTWYQSPDASLGQLKYHYALVSNPSAKVYSSLEDAVKKSGNFGYLPNYPAYVAYARSEEREEREFYLVTYGWMAAEDLQPLTPSTFNGLILTRQVDFRFGWVLAESWSINGAGEPVNSYQRYQVVHEYPADATKEGYFALGPDEWLPEASLALVNPGVPQDAGENTCRFIYVSIPEQTLLVFNACQLVFATLVSTGEDSRWTFPGRFAILFKVDYNSINPPEGSISEYYIEGVPYFMTYFGDLGFHGAYWHDDFGAPASHGCINLSPTDARWLFDWSWLGERVIISAEE